MQAGKYKNVCVRIEKSGTGIKDRGLIHRFVEMLNVLSEVYDITIKADITISKSRPDLKLVCPSRSVN